MKRLFPLAAPLCFMAAASAEESLKLVRTIPMPGVEGRIDHLAIDVKAQRLFLAALENNTLEVLDLRAGKRVQTLSGLSERQGAASDPATERLFVADGGSGQLYFFDGNPLKKVRSVAVGDDADNVRVEAGGKRVYVGSRSGALVAADARDGQRLGETGLAAHPESFQLEEKGLSGKLP